MPRLRAALLFTAVAFLGGCSPLAPKPPEAVPPASTPAPAPPREEQGAAIAAFAAALIGSRYAFGGADQHGFDCSGLALYVHERAGISIPRTAAEQQRAARPVPLKQLRPGDLVFFRFGRRGIDHVGVYSGAGRFIHAPHAGVAVASAELAGGYYARHLVSAGRFWGAAVSSP